MEDKNKEEEYNLETIFSQRNQKILFKIINTFFIIHIKEKIIQMYINVKKINIRKNVLIYYFRFK